jgi:hypothetical protein
MATTKTQTDIWDGITLSAGALSISGASIDLSTGYGGQVYMKITNGGTGPTVAGQVQIQVSPDDVKFFDYGTFVAGTASSLSYSWSPDIPIGVTYLKLIAGSNTGQNVTIDASIINVVSVA